MAVLGTQGFGALPKHCGPLMAALFGAAVLLCLARDLLPPRWARFVPSPMAMGLPFYLGECCCWGWLAWVQGGVGAVALWGTGQRKGIIGATSCLPRLAFSQRR